MSRGVSDDRRSQRCHRTGQHAAFFDAHMLVAEALRPAPGRA